MVAHLVDLSEIEIEQATARGCVPPRPDNRSDLPGSGIILPPVFQEVPSTPNPLLCRA
jgi:hypothetical protein